MQIVEGDNVKGVQQTKQKESEQIKCLVLNCSGGKKNWRKNS